MKHLFISSLFLVFTACGKETPQTIAPIIKKEVNCEKYHSDNLKLSMSFIASRVLNQCAHLDTVEQSIIDFESDYTKTEFNCNGHTQDKAVETVESARVILAQHRTRLGC